VTPTAQKLLPDPTQPLQADWKQSVHSTLSQQAQRSPEHLAVVDQQDRWTYADLEARSNQLAHYLLTNGIQSQDIVAIYAHRSASLVWALLGILKTRAAFVMLDPAYPAERLMQYLQATQPRGFIHLEAAGPLPDTLEVFVERLSCSCRVLLPRRSTLHITDVLETYSTEDPGIMIGPDDLAYVAFTSGSTGQPKGVLGRHGPLSHFLPWQAKTFGLSASDRFSMLSGLSHDPLQRDIFTALWVGGTICIPDPDTVTMPGQLAQWMAEQDITFAHLTPPMCQILTETAAADCRLPSLRYTFFVGDRLMQRDVAQLRRLAPRVTCINSYGSTETQRAVGYSLIPPEKDVPSKAVYPLGQGMPNVQLLILNAERQLAGIGELGEIYVRSPHLAQGYLGDETITQRRFLPNPFMNDAGDRVYKTGDLGRYLPDGSVEYVGRTDRQMKIRGFRIELGEIEAVLGQHPAVQGCVVIAREDTPGEPRLVAYVLPNESPELSMGELRSFLKSKLPEYMVPAAFVVLHALPLTPNGKVNYQALPVPHDLSLDLQNPYTAPRSSVEKQLADIWAKLLGLERVGIHDDFFDLGGHSLLATRVLTRMRQISHVEVPLRAFFEAPTVAAMAAIIMQQKAAQVEPDVLARLLAEVEGPSTDGVSPHF
jgi:amino acid adenylation domain-containing protein